MRNKRQHIVPRSYLNAWCDPQCPEGQTPYVWVFSKDGTEVDNKSPEKIFRENDFYTVHEDGQRDLTLEDNLSRLESEFASVRRNKLDKRLRLSSKEEFILCMFVMAMYGRTKAYKEHWSEQWQKALEFAEHFRGVMAAASPEERKRLASALPDGEVEKEKGLSMDDVRKMVERPIQNSLSTVVTEISPLLFNIPFIIVEAPENLDFITSDAPCVWFDPSGPPGLSSPDIEITLPLSPRQMIFFGRKLIARGIYLPFKDATTLESLNRRTRLNAHEHFIFNHNKARDSWF